MRKDGRKEAEEKQKLALTVKIQLAARQVGKVRKRLG